MSEGGRETFASSFMVWGQPSRSADTPWRYQKLGAREKASSCNWGGCNTAPFPGSVEEPRLLRAAPERGSRTQGLFPSWYFFNPTGVWTPQLPSALGINTLMVQLEKLGCGKRNNFPLSYLGWLLVGTYCSISLTSCLLFPETLLELHSAGSRRKTHSHNIVNEEGTHIQVNLSSKLAWPCTSHVTLQSHLWSLSLGSLLLDQRSQEPPGVIVKIAWADMCDMPSTWKALTPRTIQNGDDALNVLSLWDPLLYIVPWAGASIQEIGYVFALGFKNLVGKTGYVQ